MLAKNEWAKVGVEEFTDEVFAACKVCFEGRIERTDEGLQITLPSGEVFLVSIREGK